MAQPPATWRAVLYSYACPTCGAAEGQACVTTGGRRTDMPHAARADVAPRCARCGTRLPRKSLDPFCPHCLLVRNLEAERYHHHERTDP